jgi:hypothetical protein
MLLSLSVHLFLLRALFLCVCVSLLSRTYSFLGGGVSMVLGTARFRGA